LKKCLFLATENVFDGLNGSHTLSKFGLIWPSSFLEEICNNFKNYKVVKFSEKLINNAYQFITT